MNPIFTVNIVKGRLQDNRIEDYIKTLSDGEYEFIIRKPRKERSNQQNKYYRGVIIKIISSEIGYTEDEIHEILKYKFNPAYLKIKDEEIRVGKSTTILSTIEFEQMLTKIREWCSMELNLFIPLPNEVLYD